MRSAPFPQVMASPLFCEVPSLNHWLLGHPTLDREHLSFVLQIRATKEAGDQQLQPMLEKLAAHLSAHFRLEEATMTEHGFPDSLAHAQEHAKVGESLQVVLQLVAEGNHHVGREFLHTLDEWFPLHVRMMDAAVVDWALRSRHAASGTPWRHPASASSGAD